MFLKRLKLTNYRKFSADQNVVEFISSKIVKKQEDENEEETVMTEETKTVSGKIDEIDVASDTTLIIGKEENEEGTEEDRKSVTIYQQISCLDDRKTTNATIIDLYGKVDISAIPNHIEKNNLYLAYQGKINGYYATSFEEAFILTNYDNALANELLKELKPQIYKSIVGENPEHEKNKENSYKWQRKLEKSKGEFASKLLYKIVNEESEENIPTLPQYISDGLDWLEEKLGGN